MPAFGQEYLTSNQHIAFPFDEDALGLARNGVSVHGAVEDLSPLLARCVASMMAVNRSIGQSASYADRVTPACARNSRNCLISCLPHVELLCG